jgi:hypothetical protein
MRPGTKLGKERQDAIVYNFSLYVKRLEDLIAVARGPEAEEIGIVEPFTTSPDMIGWPLKYPTDETSKVRKSLFRGKTAAAQEAQLHVPGCGLTPVPQEEVKRGGMFRGNLSRRPPNAL